MKGLLIKDLILVKKHNLGFFFVAAIFFALSVIQNTSMYFSYYSIAMISLIPIFTMAYDEAYKWSKFEAIIPVKKQHIVLEKYILIFIFISGNESNEIFQENSQSKIFHYAKGMSIENTASLAYLMLFVGFISPAIVLPLNFRFGYLKGKLINLIVIALMASTITAINLRNSTGETAIEGQFTPQADAFLFALLAVILVIISIVVSIILYRKREF